MDTKIMNLLELPDYNKVLDKEVVELYKDKTHMIWEPLMYQLHLDIKKLIEALEKR